MKKLKKIRCWWKYSASPSKRDMYRGRELAREIVKGIRS